jgi:DeoR family fructose operon transcriptional repressor
MPLYKPFPNPYTCLQPSTQSRNTVASEQALALTSRQKKILDLIKNQQAAHVSQLAERLEVSEASIRTDLSVLQNQDLVRRFHGGARLVRSSAYEERLAVNRRVKARIARRALDFVEPGETIFLDSGTTVLMLAQLLVEIERLTVITNSVPIASQIGREQANAVILAGGSFNFSEQCCEGPMTEKFLDSFLAAKAFIGSDAVDVHKGLFSNGITMFSYLQKIVQNSRETILLSDSSKFTKTGAIKICDLRDIDVVISDRGLPGECQEALRSVGIRLELVQP